MEQKNSYLCGSVCKRLRVMVNIKFPDGNIREFESGVTGLEIAKAISNKLAKEALSVSVNGETWDLTRPINNDAEIKFYTWDDEEGRHTF